MDMSGVARLRTYDSHFGVVLDRISLFDLSAASTAERKGGRTKQGRIFADTGRSVEWS
jgi:hypothetical protein